MILSIKVLLENLETRGFFLNLLVKNLDCVYWYDLQNR